MITSHDIEHIDDIIHGYGDWFTAYLIRLIGKADDNNRERIRLSYPTEVALWERWYYKTPEYTAKFYSLWRAENHVTQSRYLQTAGDGEDLPYGEVE